MFCPNCGKKLEDGAKFCDSCGTKVAGEEPVKEGPVVEKVVEKKKEPEVEKPKVFKCPYCGEILPFDAVTCPSCGKEIRGKDAVVSVSKLSMKLLDVEDEDEKIMLIKTFPIPNAREDILEFMILATTSFDAKYYISNRQKDSVASAWLTKIDQCYKKAQIMLTAKRDLEQVEKLYQEVQKKIKSKSILKLVFIICGFLFIGGGTALILALGQSYTFATLVGIILIVLGILGLVFGFKKKKTNKEIAEEKAQQQKLEEAKINAKKEKDIAKINAKNQGR